MQSLSHACDSKIFLFDLKKNLRGAMLEVAQNHESLMRFSGLPIGLCWSLLILADTVATLGELLIKGLANILGSPFSDKCNLLKGLKQIGFQLPAYVLLLVVATPATLVNNLIIFPVKVFRNPIKEFENRFELVKRQKEIYIKTSQNIEISTNISNEIMLINQVKLLRT